MFLKEAHTQFDFEYNSALLTVLNGEREKDGRTGRAMLAAHGVFISVPFGLPLLTVRDINLGWLCAEVGWFLSGSKSQGWMESFGYKNWSKFADADGLSFGLGARWAKDRQLDRVRAMLELDPSAKRGVLSAWHAEEDLRMYGDALRRANAPCVPLVHFTVINGRLHASAVQRSADMFYGLPHDIAGIALIQHLMASRIGAEPGGISWLIGNAHVYDNQLDACEELVDRARSRSGVQPNFRLRGAKPEWWDRGLAGDKSLVFDLRHSLEGPYLRATLGKVASMPELVV